jgi:membrane-bound lytic murein transglycosylase D
MIKKILAEEGLPQELIFLAQAESGFVPRAVSNKLCVGLWQFAKFRGEEYGLTVNSTLDERMDPEKATRAAAHHLHDLYKHLGNWYLAMAAYDCGPNCVDHAVERTGYADFWALRRMNALPKETANYVPVILAMIIVSENAKDYGLDDIEPDSPLQYETVSVDSPTGLALVAAAELKELNPALLNQIAPTGYRLRIPTGTRDALDQAFAAVPSSQRDNWRLHRVESGDTPSTLAKQYGVSAKQVLEANHGELPEAGSFAAIPAGYPSEHVRSRHTSSRRHRTTAKESSPRPAKAATVAHKSSKHKTAHHPDVAEEGKPTSGRKPAPPARVPGA